MRFYGSSASTNSKESQGWDRRINHLHHHRYSASDGTGLFVSSPSDHSQGHQWTPTAVQEINVDEFVNARRKDPVFRRPPLTPSMEGTSGNADGGASPFSCSDSGESEPTMRRSCLSSHHTFSSRRFFQSKPVHPLSLSNETAREASDSTDAHSWSSVSNSSFESADIHESLEPNNVSRPHQCNTSRCGLCDRFLSQKSPWSSSRIVRTGDMPITGVLPCRHVFHAECIEQTTPKMHANDPPCPICLKHEGERSPVPRVRDSLTRLKPFREHGQSSRPWGCVQAGDCVEGALNVPPRNPMTLLNRNRFKKSLSLRGNSSNAKKNGPDTMQHLTGKLTGDSSIRWPRGKETAP